MEDKTPLLGKTFVFTGEMTMDREVAKSKVVMLGGRVTALPSGKTDFLVAGTDPGPSKIAKAKQLVIKTLSEQEFTAMIQELSKDFVDTMEVEKATSNNEDKKALSNEPWCEKYRPKKLEDLVGNNALIESLTNFLKGNTKYKAALLSGQPGVGKTTSVQICANDLDLDLIEFNASDTRNKSEIAATIKNTLNTYSLTRSMQKKKKVLLMDEIDGMTSDRGGLAELTNVIKNAKIPIVCICNDRNNPKIRTLANHCLDLRFRKLEARQVLPSLKYILDQENKQMKDNMINEIVLNSNGDLRYCLNTLQNLLLRKTISHEQISLLTKKTIAKNLFDVASEVFGKKKIKDKIDLYFEDYSMIPLFVQDNYVKMNFRNVNEIRRSIQSISFSDLIDKHIHGYNQEWGLLPNHAFFSTIYPTHGKNLVKRLDFPAFLGMLSKRNKNVRNLSEAIIHMHNKFRINKTDFRIYGLDILVSQYVNALLADNVDKAIKIMVDLDIMKTDVENLIEIALEGTDQMKNVSTKTKGLLTRTYKKLRRNLPYSVDEIKATVADEDND